MVEDILLVLFFICLQVSFISHCDRKAISRLNELLLGNLTPNRERIILPSSQRKIKKKILSLLTNQHSVILPSMLLTIQMWWCEDNLNRKTFHFQLLPEGAVLGEVIVVVVVGFWQPSRTRVRRNKLEIGR